MPTCLGWQTVKRMTPFNLMRMAAAQYQADPSPTNAVKAHLAARRYIEVVELRPPLAPLDGDRP